MFGILKEAGKEDEDEEQHTEAQKYFQPNRSSVTPVWVSN